MENEQSQILMAHQKGTNICITGVPVGEDWKWQEEYLKKWWPETPQIWFKKH